MTSLYKRILTGMVLVLVICIAVLSGEVPFLLLLLLVNQSGLMEYQKIVQMGTYSVQGIALQLTGLVVLVAAWLIGKGMLALPVLLLLPVLVPLLLAVELYRKKCYPFQDVGLTLLGITWISVPLGLFLYTSYLPLGSEVYHPFAVLGYFVILWLGDSGAYIAGKLTGRHSLFQRISPKKTWEGVAGGLAAAWFAGLMNFYLFEQFFLSQWLLLALVITITGTFGDLVKSLLKRSAGVKDSGTILPGHGGILDRFDSLIGSAPFAFLYVLFYA